VNSKPHNKLSGFSLTEMLIATGIMAIGLVMVATIFPVGVKLTSMSTERTIGAVVADEAFAKIQLYGLRDFQFWPSAQRAGGDPDATYEACDDFLYTNLYDIGPDGQPATGDEPATLIDDTGDFIYPSAEVPVGQQRNYHWSALCRRVGAKEVQVTVFVTRKIAAASQYRAWDDIAALSDWPKPVKVQIDSVVDPRTLEFSTTGPWSSQTREFFDEGCTIVDNYSGRIYRVLEVKDTDSDNMPDTLLLQQDWVDSGLLDETIWVVPPAVGSDRYPCVGVYQKTIYFENIN
jgi:prepilin-type N-terminal cleavage/methylation domain-containing protein